MKYYSPFLFSDIDRPFLKALRTFIAEPNKRNYNYLMQFPIQHAEDLLLVQYRDTVVARSDFITIKLRRLRGELEEYSYREVIITKSSLSPMYCIFILGERLLPILNQAAIDELQDWGYFHIQGNIYVDISKRSVLDKDYIPIKRKTLLIGRHVIYLEGSNLFMNNSAEYYQALGNLKIHAEHPEHGSTIYQITLSKPIILDFHVRHDRHITHELANKLLESLP